MIRALVLGASGYGGGELLRWLCGHPAVGAVQGVSRSRAGEPFHAVHPNLRGFLPGAFLEAPDWDFLAEGTPVVFAAMPHGELAKQMPALEAAWSARGLDPLVIDLSADFRLDPAWTYGLSEWNADALRGARRIANPGCFATALELALMPLAGLELGMVAASAVTGSSGSGWQPSEGTHHPTRAQDLRVYKVLCHQHEAEVEAQWRRAAGTELDWSFVPHSGPFVRGIFATLQLRVPPGTDLRARFEAAYAEAPFVRLVEGSPRLGAVTGSAFADLGVHQEGSKAALTVALDNLGKGMASQAVQNLNLALGLDPMAGLRVAGPYPG